MNTITILTIRNLNRCAPRWAGVGQFSAFDYCIGMPCYRNLQEEFTFPHDSAKRLPAQLSWQSTGMVAVSSQPI
ncbi:MAG: hypothetical protein M3N23_11105, partial [Pseudomonadota bacterium]|nr:hypothetical protein [Pseudomonadota bacterium]